MTSRIAYDDDQHRYELDGERVPNPSTACDRVLAKPGLVPWAAKLGAEWALSHADGFSIMGREAWLREAGLVPNATRNRKGDRGTELHAYAVNLALGEPVEPVHPDGSPWDADMLAMVRHAADFQDRFELTPIIHETIVYNELHRWAGRLDIVAELNDGKRWLLDYTTSSGVYPGKVLQVAAYRHATHVVAGDDDMAMPEVDATGVVRLHPGGWELVPTRSDLTVYGYFLHVLALYGWARWRRDETLGMPTRGGADIEVAS